MIEAHFCQPRFPVYNPCIISLFTDPDPFGMLVSHHLGPIFITACVVKLLPTCFFDQIHEKSKIK